MLEQPLLFISCSSNQFFSSPPLPKHSQLGHTSYPTPQCAALVFKICKDFANGSSANIKFSKIQLSKIVKLG